MNPKFETFKAGLGNGLIARHKYGYYLTIDPEFLFVYKDEQESLTPYLFSLEDLMTPIRVEGYNDGKEFVFTELWEVGDEGCEAGYEFDNGNIKLLRTLEDIARHNVTHDVKYLPSAVVDLMRKLHFNTEGLSEFDYINAAESKVYEPKSE